MCNWTTKEVVAFNDKTEITSIAKIRKHLTKNKSKNKMAFLVRKHC